ncbi:hypothetical protein RGQ13_17360 [Thalassotalea psychrophila]|uniref:Uncharacterized protein n=1 Tax=Thalassotalea psychrophila TaxID=3065647 RepID=A0ABY9TSX3_9GAMM|nr:hypothetical protein RGQ13_17360 [Colwelliaceae bacterium SQ149]
MRKRNYLCTAMLVSLSLVACANDQPQEKPTTKKEALPMKHHTPPPPSELSKAPMQGQWYVGTLKFYNLEGGFFGFIGDNGERFLPLNLDKKYQQNGAIIKIFGKVDNDIMTIQQWGQPFRVEQVEVIKAGKKSTTNPEDI